MLKLPELPGSEVFHVGTLNAADKGEQSWEGAGLSVCCEEDLETWQEIARIGGPWWRLSNPTGRFLDFWALTSRHRATVARWGVDHDLVTRQVRFAHIYHDSELDSEVSALYPTLAGAREAAELDDAGRVARRTVLCPTAGLARALAPVRPFEDCFDHLLTVYCERETDLDGVWWQDRHGHLSAPRGVILPGHLAAWQRERITGS